ncbi:MAG: hypothetical protein NTX30_23845 [Deltaproteobacteria bacterium]|nr:hypothetical protein [Deltaproteobacteria bacterium]
MITAAQEDHIERHAYLPEHVPEYVTAISRTEAFLFGDFLAYAKRGHLILVGYPLEGPFEEKRMERALEEAVKHLSPESVSLMAPSIPASLGNEDHPPSDHYYRLDLSTVNISQKLRNMVKRAGRELSVGGNTQFDEDHKEMVEAFLKTHSVDEATRFILRRIDQYLSSSRTASIFDARTGGGKLVAFTIAEFKPRDYAMYMFNFSSDARYVPGASDMLLARVIEQAKMAGKKYINLGLGINPGISFFKEKWGGVAFLPHAFCLYHPSRKGLLEMILQWL